MKLTKFGLVALLLAVLPGISGVALADAPVAKLVQVEGDVQYTRNGTAWRPVNRTKYLFAGYQIKTGEDGSGKLINQETGLSQELGANTVIKIGDDDIAVVSGSLSKPKEESTSLFQSLLNKFQAVQRYTTVRRSVGTDQVCDMRLRTVSKVALSTSHPSLVWRNVCPEVSYRLVINGESHDVPAQSSAEMIRYDVPDMKPGSYDYHVEVVDRLGKFVPRSDSTLVWLAPSASNEIDKKLSELDGDILLKADILEKNDMYVAVMDSYRDYFQDNPDDNDMRPMLMKAYNDLKLVDLQENEAALYEAAKGE
ncbi:MAG: hypothetical protein KDI19_01765 [Pseudomonadales bacterium]|nr:hypothetical protein [Pseudomonadales bacterium]